MKMYIKEIVCLLLGVCMFVLASIDIANWPYCCQLVFFVLAVLSCGCSIGMGLSFICHLFAVLFKRLFKKSPSDQEVEK